MAIARTLLSGRLEFHLSYVVMLPVALSIFNRPAFVPTQMVFPSSASEEICRPLVQRIHSEFCAWRIIGANSRRNDAGSRTALSARLRAVELEIVLDLSKAFSFWFRHCFSLDPDLSASRVAAPSLDKDELSGLIERACLQTIEIDAARN
jgi:hypothetical protein